MEYYVNVAAQEPRWNLMAQPKGGVMGRKTTIVMTCVSFHVNPLATRGTYAFFVGEPSRGVAKPKAPLDQIWFDKVQHRFTWRDGDPIEEPLPFVYGDKAGALWAIKV